MASFHPYPKQWSGILGMDGFAFQVYGWRRRFQIHCTLQGCASANDVELWVCMLGNMLGWREIWFLRRSLVRYSVVSWSHGLDDLMNVWRQRFWILDPRQDRHSGSDTLPVVKMLGNMLGKENVTTPLVPSPCIQMDGYVTKCIGQEEGVFVRFWILPEQKVARHWVLFSSSVRC